MALYCMECQCGWQKDRLFRTSKEADAGIPCPECGKVAKRRVHAPTCHNKEVIKKPFQAKDIERYSDIKKLMHERSHTDYTVADPTAYTVKK